MGYGQRSRLNILLQHMHKKEFWIFTNKCENYPKHENEAEGPWSATFWCLRLFPHLLVKIQNSFLCMC